jgi:predicted HD superfamily hydrolase involved in NAD metabolism
MHPILAAYIGEITLTNDIINDASTLLINCGHLKTCEHSRRVAKEAKKLAQRWGDDEARAEIAGWLHDISVIIPEDQRVSVTEAFRLDILPEERIAPVLLHQKLSTFMAHDIFKIADEPVLDAIGCHTTLRANSSVLDKIVFIADKIAWDQPGDPPYLTEMVSVLDRSLDLAAFYYLDYLWQQKDTLPALHPWVLQAYQQLLSETLL